MSELKMPVRIGFNLDIKHSYHQPKNDQMKKNYRTSEVSFSHIPQGQHSCIEVGFMNDTEIQ